MQKKKIYQKDAKRLNKVQQQSQRVQNRKKADIDNKKGYPLKKRKRARKTAYKPVAQQ
ncbi:hypothetical protein [Bartonella tamiae]|uniref:hypothetical protein n=1 Tax=Bartonella tamiae TaxID=373638 RepID=UPI0012DF93CC|nr:hypothetical protein [Bartonella tamiae]